MKLDSSKVETEAAVRSLDQDQPEGPSHTTQQPKGEPSEGLAQPSTASVAEITEQQPSDVTNMADDSAPITGEIFSQSRWESG